MNIDAEGLIDGAEYIPSPNCDERPAGMGVELLVIHNISLPPGVFGGDAVIDLFLNRLDPRAHPYYETIATLRVSAHFLIRRNGGLLQFVPCTKRAWHAGQSSWRDRERCNDFSVGIELEGADDQAYSDAQYECLAALATALCARYPIVASVGHSDIAPGRKTDPGPAFDWRRYASGIGNNIV
ncbi:MAG: 1,6-anhydro-N-acetylmuramyl-L-alanine amidase AmpD [Burkholderiales bacterium]|nr:1,6-anhydro-N-acetylmuramyl-L-alanine amidase AmpD [Burkholderiales bacterium]